MTNELIECKVCGDDVAKSALKCPHCGARLRMHPFLKFLLIVVCSLASIALVIFMIVLAMSIVIVKHVG